MHQPWDSIPLWLGDLQTDGSMSLQPDEIATTLFWRFDANCTISFKEWGALSPELTTSAVSSQDEEFQILAPHIELLNYMLRAAPSAATVNT